MKTGLACLACCCCLLASAAVGAPAGDGKPQLVAAILTALRDDVNSSASGGDRVSKTQTVTETTVRVPGDSTSTAALTAASSTPKGRETAASTVLATGEASPGDRGISATISAVKGGAGTKDGRAGSDGTAVIGSIAVTDGKISTSTAIVKTSADTDNGSTTDALGLTSSFGPDGEARGIQDTSSRAGPSDESTTQADLNIGSSVGDIGTRVSVAGGSQMTGQSPRITTKRPSIIELARRLLAAGYKLNRSPPTHKLPYHKPTSPPRYTTTTSPPDPHHYNNPPHHYKNPPHHYKNPPHQYTTTPPPSHKNPPPYKKSPPPAVKSPAGGAGTIRTESATEIKMTVPGSSSSQSALQTASSTPNNQQTSTSTVVSRTAADPGKNGISATITSVDGRGRLGSHRAGSEGTLLTGSIAVNDGQISTSTAIVKTAGDTDRGTKSDALGMTSSFGTDGEARGVQHSSSSTGSSRESVSQADLTVGSSTGEVGTQVSVAGRSKTTKTVTTAPPPIEKPSSIESEKKRLGIDK